jgi:hypothetical protein
MLNADLRQITIAGNVILSPARQINTAVSGKAEHFFAFLQLQLSINE